MLSWQIPGSPQRVASRRSQRTLVAFQYGLLILSGVDSAAAIYLILGPGDEVTIAGASPMLTAVSTTFARSTSCSTLKLCRLGGSVRHVLVAPSDRLLALLQKWPLSLSSPEERPTFCMLDDIEGNDLVLGGSSSSRIGNSIKGTVLCSRWKRSFGRCRD